MPSYAQPTMFDVGTVAGISVNMLGRLNSLLELHLYMQKAFTKSLLCSETNIVLGAESYVKEKHMAPASKRFKPVGEPGTTAEAMINALVVVSSQKRSKSLPSGKGKSQNIHQRENEL